MSQAVNKLGFIPLEPSKCEVVIPSVIVKKNTTNKEPMYILILLMSTCVHAPLLPVTTASNNDTVSGNNVTQSAIAPSISRYPQRENRRPPDDLLINIVKCIVLLI